jgi:hypothetical protein
MDAKRDVAPWVERFARVGYVAKAVLYGTVGALAAGSAFGHGETIDTRGAMMKLLGAPFGPLVLAVIAAGLLGYAAWRCTSAIVDAEGRGSDLKGLALRASFLVRGLAHAVLGYSAVRLAFNASAGQVDRGEQATNFALRVPGGVWLVWAGAIGIGAFGLYQVYRAVVAKLSKQLRQRKMDAEVGGWVVWVSRFGIAARGLVFLAIAWAVGKAAMGHNPTNASGIDDALDRFAQVGPLPFAAIGAGLIAYGVYELMNARYRRIEAV